MNVKEDDLFRPTGHGHDGNVCYTAAKSQPTFLCCNPRDRHAFMLNRFEILEKYEADTCFHFGLES